MNDQEVERRKLFLMANPSQFHGDMDPIVVSDWIMEMENAFDRCTCLDGHTVIYASFLLRGQALYWWNMIKVSRGIGKQYMLWDQFKELIYKSYILESPKHELEDIACEYQGSKSVQAYTAEFYSQNVRFRNIVAATEEKKTTLFIRGLKSQIKDRLDMANLKEFEEVVQQAITVEKALAVEKPLALERR